MRYLVFGGHSAGRFSAMVSSLMECQRGKVACPDLDSLDKLVARGVQPSQIMVASEFKRTDVWEIVHGRGD